MRQRAVLLYQAILSYNCLRNTDDTTVTYIRQDVWKKRRLCHRLCLAFRSLSDTHCQIKRFYKVFLRLYLLLLIFKQSLFLLNTLAGKDLI